jgi:RNA polymerase sigma-70 factor (ECF subfamily)
LQIGEYFLKFGVYTVDYGLESRMLIRKPLFAGHLLRSRKIRVQIEQSRPRLYRIAFAWCQDYHVAQDVVQEALEKALKHTDRLKQDAALNVWLYRILNNSWRDYCRRHRDFDEFDDCNTPSTDPGPERHQIELQTVRAVRQAVRELPLGFRQVVALIDLEGCSYMEAAQILDVPVGTIMSRVARARKRLRESLLALPSSSQHDAVPKIRRIK